MLHHIIGSRVCEARVPPVGRALATGRQLSSRRSEFRLAAEPRARIDAIRPDFSRECPVRVAGGFGRLSPMGLGAVIERWGLFRGRRRRGRSFGRFAFFEFYRRRWLRRLGLSAGTGARGGRARGR